MEMKKYIYNYFITGGAAAFFLLLAFIDLLSREDKNDPNFWAKSWDYMSLFGKIDCILFVVLFVWTIAIQLVKSKWS
jgi:hypothetical protein